MKTCTKCKAEKPLSEFYNNKNAKDSKSGYCKQCSSETAKEYKTANRRIIRAITSKFRDKHKTKVRQEKAEYKKNNKEKIRANNALWYAVRGGKLTRPGICEVCNEQDKIQGHHEDYEHPLIVVWACAPCHGEIHKGVTHQADQIRLRVQEIHNIKINAESTMLGEWVSYEKDYFKHNAMNPSI